MVVMARRYLDEKDARAKMRLDEWAAEAKRHRARDAKKKSGSARRTSTRARVPGTGDEARRRKRRDAG